MTERTADGSIPSGSVRPGSTQTGPTGPGSTRPGPTPPGPTPPLRYVDKPWLAQLTAAQRSVIHPPTSVLHAFRAAADRAPHHPALVYFDGRLSYGETDALSDSVAGHLAARGLARGDRVAIMLQNTPQFVIALLAAWKAGAIVVPVNPMYKSGEITHVLADAAVSALVCSDRAWESFLRETARTSPYGSC